MERKTGINRNMIRAERLPEFARILESAETFNFACHQDVSCFTACCRMLELAITPYDVLRLRRATGMTSQELLDNYIIVEQDPGEAFPRFYLTMVDDGKASCVFVSEKGCTVYPHRPAACRAYPLGRAVQRDGDSMAEVFVLLQEPHCRGFEEAVPQTITLYSQDQELHRYNASNDKLMQILHHDAIRQGLIPTEKQIELFVLALYNLDTFRGQLPEEVPADTLTRLMENDEALLDFGIQHVSRELFTPIHSTNSEDD